MRTLQEVKDDVSFRYDWVDWVCFLCDCPEFEKDVVFNEVVKEYALEVAREVLKNASENAVIEPMGMMTRVDKQSILHETNIPELI